MVIWVLDSVFKGTDNTVGHFRGGIGAMGRYTVGTLMGGCYEDACFDELF